MEWRKKPATSDKKNNNNNMVACIFCFSRHSWSGIFCVRFEIRAFAKSSLEIFLFSILLAAQLVHSISLFLSSCSRPCPYPSSFAQWLAAFLLVIPLHFIQSIFVFNFQCISVLNSFIYCKYVFAFVATVVVFFFSNVSCFFPLHSMDACWPALVLFLFSSFF